MAEFRVGDKIRIQGTVMSVITTSSTDGTSSQSVLFAVDGFDGTWSMTVDSKFAQRVTDDD